METFACGPDYDAQFAYSKEVLGHAEEKKGNVRIPVGSYQVNDTWRLTTVLDVKASLSAVNNMTIVIIIVSLLLLCVFNALSTVIARRIARPISPIVGAHAQIYSLPSGKICRIRMWKMKKES